MPGPLRGEFRFGAQDPNQASRREDAPVLQIVVLADLRGRAGRENEDLVSPISQRRLVRVDVDSFDEVLARTGPRLQLDLPGLNSAPLPIVFRSLDDFHPDALYRGLEPFGPLRDVRRRLLDASTFAGAAAEWSRAVGLLGEAPPEASAASPSATEDDEATRRRLLGRGPIGGSHVPPAVASAQARLDQLLREIVAPHIVPAADRRLPELLRSVDETAAALLRAMLHHPDFQALESVWRSIHGLVTEIEADAGVEVWLLDVTRAELQGDGLMALERLLTGREAAEDVVWHLLIVGFTFGPDEGDITLLDRLGAITGRISGPAIAAADPGLVGCRSFAETPDPQDWKTLDAGAVARWRRLRKSPCAPWIGLAMPRILLRLPYGKRTDPIESFDFEELSSGRDHEAYLWGNPAFACARLIASSFVENGAAMEPGDHLALDNLPAAVYDDEDGPKMKPCAETSLSEAAAQRILDEGAMPLLASSRRNAVRLMRFQSIAHPPGPLAGRWGHPSYPPSDR